MVIGNTGTGSHTSCFSLNAVSAVERSTVEWGGSYTFPPLYHQQMICSFAHRKKWRRHRAVHSSTDKFLGCRGDSHTANTRGRPSANAANSYLEFTACKSQKFGHWANIQPLLEKAKKLTIFIGNSAPLRTFFLKNLEKFDYRFLSKQKLFIGPF